MAETERAVGSRFCSIGGATCPWRSFSENQPRGRTTARCNSALLEKLDIDLLVMGTVCRTGIPGFIIGNTAESMIHTVNCSVLALKPQGFVSPVEIKEGR